MPKDRVPLKDEPEEETLRSAYWSVHNAMRRVTRLAAKTQAERSRYNYAHDLIARDMVASLSRWEVELHRMWTDYHDAWELSSHGEV